MDTRAAKPLFLYFLLSLAAFEVALFLGFSIRAWPTYLAVNLLCVLVFLAWRDRLEELAGLLTKRVVITLFALQAAGWILYVVLSYYAANYALYDTGIFAQSVWNFSRGETFNSIVQVHAFADHFIPNLFLLVPFYWIEPTSLWLPIFKLVAYLACVPLLWALSGHYVKDVRYRWLVLVLWLVSFPLLRTLQFEFQPSSLALPFVFLAFLLCTSHEKR